MSSTGTGNTPTLVGWIAAILVGALVYAVLRYQVGFLMPAAVAIGIAATLLVILLLSSSGGAVEETDKRVRKIVPQPEKVVVEAARPVMPTRVSAAPKVEPKPVAAVEPPASVGAPVAAPAPAEPVALMAAPAAAAELVAKPEVTAPKAEVPAAKPKAEAKPKAAKPKAEKPAPKPKAKPAKAEGLVRLTAARGGKADDLKELEGVGPALEKLVNGLGFYHFDQIAAWTHADVALVDDEMKNFKGRIARDRWVAQAKIIVTEGLEAFRERAKTNNY